MSNTDISLSFKSQFGEYSTNGNTSVRSMISLVAPKDTSEKEGRPSIDLVCCIDVSGSMSGEKINLVKQTLTYVVEVLNENDNFGIVTFSNTGTERLPLISMNKAGKNKAKKIINSLIPDSMTNIHDGLYKSILTLNKLNSITKNDVRAIIMFTDGLTNVGVTTTEGIIDMVKANKKSNELDCSVYTFGFGSDHDAVMLRSISEKNGGMYFYVENGDQIPKLFANCLGGLVSSVASKIELKLECLSDSKLQKIYTGFNYTEVEPGKVYTVQLFDLQEEERRDVVLDLILPESEETPDFLALKLTLSFVNLLEKNSPSKKVELLGFIDRKVTPRENQEEDAEIVENYLRFQSVEAIQNATKLAKEQKFDEAKSLLGGLRNEISNNVYALRMDYLADDLQTVEAEMSESAFSVKGIYQANAIASAQDRQRSTGIGKDKFVTQKKKSMMKAFSLFK